LRAVRADAGAIVGDIDILDPEERGAVAAPEPEFDEDEFVVAGGTELPQLLTAAVEDDPDAPALAAGETETSFRELDA
ncbi:hypothetical protein LAN33_27550, partial [Mycobacterium tuberculosis]|nr:hypothetical protein [Mycobacterium tuberculosis]